MEVMLQRQVARRRCDVCAVDFTVVRGPVFGDGTPLGLYLVGLHGHSPEGRIAHLVMAVVDPNQLEPEPVATALEIRSTSSHFSFSVVDPGASPLSGEPFLGQVLTREEMLHCPKNDLFFHIAEHVVNDLPEVCDYFGEPNSQPERAEEKPGHS
jgi:hypothetical protein